MRQERFGSNTDLMEEMAVLRRDIHRHPETAFEERRTADIVAETLASFGLAVHRGLGKTGVVGTLKGRHKGTRAIGLRADMDALNLEEKNTFAHRSVHAGKMHACGHDGHTAMLLGAAGRLAADPDFAGTVHFIFQPAEEGQGGGKAMIDDGLFELFPCDAVYGMHNAPGLPVGCFAIRPGPMMAASDSWQVVFKGTGGHGSAPHKGSDPTLPAAQFVQALQGIIGRDVPPAETAVLSVGHIHGGAAASPNVIPAEVVVAGTARSYTPEVRDLLERRMGEVAAALAGMNGCSSDYLYDRRYPPLVNAEAQTAIALRAAQAVAGPGKVDGMTAPVTGAEDFAFMLEAKPGAYIFIGNGGDAAGGCHFVHTPLYDFNDAILPLGAEYWVALVAEELGT